jgi:cyclase
MHKVRIIPTLLYNNTLVKGKNFNSWRVVSDLHTMIILYNLREVDELIFFDANATFNNFIDLELIDHFADDCFVPLTIGGGVKNITDIENLLKVGADKICINSAAVENPEFVMNAINKYGSQCIVISIDYKINNNNQKEVFINSGKKKTGILLEEHLKKMSDLNPCEIILTSIDHDGIMKGYDVKTISLMNSISSCPIIASGGAGTCDDIFNVISESGIKAVSSASIYHFTETTPLDDKKYLNEKGILVRL